MANPVCILLAFTLASTCVLAAALPPTPMEGLLPNGNFEDPPKAIDIKKTVLLHKNALPKWEITGLVDYIHGGPQLGGMYFPVAHDVHAVRLGNEATISQTIPVKSGSLYAITFGVSRTCAQQEVLRVSVPPQSGDLPLQTLYSSDDGDVYAYGFKANSNSVRLSFHNPGVQEDPKCGPLIDAVAIKELLPPRPTPLNLVKNGGFKEGPHRLFNSSNGVLLPPRQEDVTSHLPGWIIESLKAVKFIDSKHFNVPVGVAAVLTFLEIALSFPSSHPCLVGLGNAEIERRCLWFWRSAPGTGYWAFNGVTAAEEGFKGNLVDWVNQLSAKGHIENAIDKNLRDTGHDAEIVEFLRIAGNCITPQPRARWSMYQVYEALKNMAQELGFSKHHDEFPLVYGTHNDAA